jgi:hypothetical protein
MIIRQVTIQIMIFLVIAAGLRAQDTETDRLVDGELKMTFPSIYFVNRSTDYAAMPYTVDSCFKYIAANIKDIKSFVIWRDSSETEKLTSSRIKKLKAGLNKYTPSGKIHIHPMDKEQKISQHTIGEGVGDKQIHYLLSLNSVLDISKTKFPTKWREKNHVELPRLWCWDCWKNGFHLQTRRKLRKMEKHKKKDSQK